MAMQFRAFRLGHGERAPWSQATHVRLRGRPADTDQGSQVISHIRRHADDQGVAAMASIEPGFPARQPERGARRAMEVDLRPMANQRDVGVSEQNKGLLELGGLE
jgi:5-methylcytosine-specific restriction enzyme B